MLVDEIFQVDNKKRLLEDLIEHTLRKPERKLFIGGSLSLDFKDDAKFVKHVNNLPVNIEKNFIINERTNMKLNKFLAIGSDRAVYDYRPDVLFDILEDKYSTNFETLG